MSQSVCIIGAGPAGLIAAKTLLNNAPKDVPFRVSVFDVQKDIGGLWPTSRADNGRLIHPLMLANQSGHTMHFSDLAWEDGAPSLPSAWMVGKYLQRYMDHYLGGNPAFELRLGTRVVSAVPSEGAAAGWKVVVRSGDSEKTESFDKVLVASGFFGKPIIPKCLQKPSEIPIVHSSAYRDLKGLLGQGRPGGGKILVVGGQMSGVEIAGTIAAHLSSAINSPDASGITDVEKYSIHNIIQRRVWVFPLYTSPEPTRAAAPFLPLDCASYNLSNRPPPLVNTQGHISEEATEKFMGICQGVLGSDQLHQVEQPQETNEETTKQPFIAASDWYSGFVRSDRITLSKGKLESLDGTTATISPSGERVEDVAAVVVATGFDASPCLDFLPQDVLQTLHHSPRHIDQPIALAFHGTHHPDVPGLGFVGFYRSPYWGVMQMQARFLAQHWSGVHAVPDKFAAKLAEDGSIERTLSLRDDPRCSQFPMGDYAFIVQEIAEAIGMHISEPLVTGLPALSHNNAPLNMLTPARYSESTDTEDAKAETRKLLEATHQLIQDGLTTPRFVARAVFRSLLGTWKLERDLRSTLPSHPSGHFSGTARFLLRQRTTDGLPNASGEDDGRSLEYLYVEEGDFKADNGFSFKATRRYVWRYNEDQDKLSVWFVKTDDEKRADYLFHEVEFENQPADGEQHKVGWSANAGHLCIDDYYNVKYNFAFQAVNLKEWSTGYTVKGPKKNYSIHGVYTR